MSAAFFGQCYRSRHNKHHIVSARTNETGVIYIEGLMVVIFGSDERSLNDVQVSSRHCHWRMTTETERQGHRVKSGGCDRWR